MGGGVLAVGISGFGFLAIVGNTMSTSDTVALTSLYMIVNVIGPGLFAGLEQETNRVVSSGIAAGVDLRDGLRRSALLGGGLVGITVLVLLAASPVLVDRTLGGHVTLVAWILLGAVTSAAVFWVRGVLGGARRFDGYAATLVVEGGSRLLPCVAIAALGWAGVNLYAAIFTAGAGFAALAAVPFRFRGSAHEPAPVFAVRAAIDTDSASKPPSARGRICSDQGAGSAEVVDPGHSVGRIARGIAFLGVATLLAQAVANLAPVVVNGRMAGDVADERVAAAFGFAFVLTRVPLLLFSPVQAMLLPTLTAAVVRGDIAAVRSRVRLVLFAIGGVGLVGVVGAGLLGPWAVQTFFAAEVAPDRGVMALLGVSAALLMVVQVLQPALVATGRHHTASLAWAAGTVLLVGLLVVPVDPVTAAVVAQLAGPAVVVAGTAVGLRSALVAHAPHQDVPSPVTAPPARGTMVG